MIASSAVTVEVDLRIYDGEALHAAVLKFVDSGFAVHVTDREDFLAVVTITSPPQVRSADAKVFFLRLLQEEQVREKLEKRFAPMREFIVREAMRHIGTTDV